MAQEWGRQVHDLLCESGLSPKKADRLTRKGLGVAGLEVDRAVDFSWVGVEASRTNRKLKNQPAWTFEVATGGRPVKSTEDLRRLLGKFAAAFTEVWPRILRAREDANVARQLVEDFVTPSIEKSFARKLKYRF